MEKLTVLFVLACAIAILLRTLSVLDHMSSSTRWGIKIVYAVESGGVVAVAVQALYGDMPRWSTLLLLAGVTLAHLVDGRLCPRRFRPDRLDRHQHNAELAGKP